MVGRGLLAQGGAHGLLEQVGVLGAHLSKGAVQGNGDDDEASSQLYKLAATCSM